MKKLISLMLTLLLAAGVLVTPALAVGEEYTFTLTVDGTAEASAVIGSTVTVALHVRNNKADSIELYGMQDYINFDPDYLEFVPGSERFFQVNGYSVISGSVLPGGGQVFTNRAGMRAIPMKNGDVLMQFQLRARKAGTVSVTSSVPEMIGGNAEGYSVALEDASVTIRPPHVHAMQKIAEVPATEQATGIREHWKCTGCGKLFWDQAGSKPATDAELLIPKMTHVHALIRIPGVEATETLLGLREHWKCSGCGKLFLDEAGTKEATQAELELPKKPHVHVLAAVAEQPATSHSTGVKAHWVCTGCGKLFLDEAGAVEVKEEALVIPKLDDQPITPLEPTPIEPKPVEPAQPSGFVDVPADAWYADAVRWAVEKGVTTGSSAITFSPELSCTRDQAVTFLWRAAGSPAPQTTVCPFTDVPADAWYRTAVLWALENGVTTGSSATTFSPGLPCSRSQIVTFLWRAKGQQAASGSLPFRDVAATDWFADAVRWAVEKGVTTGSSATTFSPELPCSRSQIVTFLWRAE